MSTAWTRFKQTLFVRAWALAKVPLLAWVRPRVVELEGDRCVVCIPLRRRTKNHLGSMYFGALAVGADIAGGLIAVELIKQKQAKVSLVFKSFKADFLKRPESDVYFICEEGGRVRDLVDRVLASDERLGENLHLRAAVLTPEGAYDSVATFELELTLKRSEKGAV